MRFGLQGPSVLHFTDGGAAPNTALFARNANWDWFDALEIDGWTPASKRGAVSGVGLANVKSGYQYVVGLKSAQAQYWATAGTGTWKILNIGKHNLKLIARGGLDQYTLNTNAIFPRELQF